MKSVSKHGRTLLNKVLTLFKNMIKNRCTIADHDIEIHIEL